MFPSGWHLCNSGLSLGESIVHSDENEFMGLVVQDGLNGTLQLFAFTFESWQNNSDIFGEEFGFVWNRDGFEGPEQEEVDDET